MRSARGLLRTTLVSGVLLLALFGATATAAATPAATPPPTVNVDAYGAVADGVTDATAALQAAEAAAGAGATVVVPAGTYRVRGIRLTVPGQVWRLQPGARFLLAPATNAPVVTVTADHVTVQGPGGIDGDAAHNGGSSNLGVFLDTGATGSVLRYLTIANTYQAGVLDYAGDVTIRSNRVVNTVGTGIYSQPGSARDLANLRIVDNTVDKSMQPAATAWGYGIQVHGLPDIHVAQRNLMIWGNTVRLPLRPITTMLAIEAWGGCPAAAISWNTVSGGTMGISADRCDGVAITRNQVASAVQNGVEVASDNHATVAHNVVRGNLITGGGITFDGASGSSHGTVVHNTVTGTIAMAVFVIDGAHDRIAGNVLVSGRGRKCYPIYAQNAPDTSIVANRLVGNAEIVALIVFDGATSTGTVTGNAGAIASRRLVYLYAGARATASANTLAA